MNVKYQSPPVNEVIVGAYFSQSLMALRSEHVGVFWSQLREDFPNIQQQPELTLPMIGSNIAIHFGVTDEPYPMPRFWLSSKDGSILIQIQKNAFILNWRKREDAYPHYEKVKGLFDKYFDAFRTFLQRELDISGIDIQMAELTYSNVVESGSYWFNAFDTTRLIPSLTILDIGAPAKTPPDFNHVASYRLETDLTLNVTVRTARKATDASSSVLVFELRALGALGDTTKADTWYDRAHETIGHCFTSMTNPDIQREYWKEA